MVAGHRADLCAGEGVFLGAISALFNAKFPGIVFQAVLLTFGTLFLRCCSRTAAA